MATQNLNQSSNSTNTQIPVLYLLNAVPLNALPDNSALLIRKIDWHLAKQLVSRFRDLGYAVISYIGHQSTAEVISAELGLQVGVNRGEAKLQHGDHALVFVLTRRLQQGTDAKVTKDDLAVYHVFVLHPDACRAIY